jgi:energy-coupling factor transport system ATP-binding protein
MDENIISFNDVSFTYESEEKTHIPAVKDITLNIRKGEFVAVLGHNGSGKSTLAKLTNAILIPEKGTVLINGLDTSDENLVYDIRRTVGMVFQNPDNQIVATIVEDDVAFGPENLGVPPAEIRRKVDEALKEVEMYEYRLREPHKLSGGQKQRVAIAGILAIETACMVLDEPTAMLDPRGRVEVMKTVMRLNKEKGITVLYITHFMDEAVEADRVLVMDNGDIILDGSPRQVFSQVELIKSVGLDVPQASELCYLLRKDGIDLPIDVLNVDECIEALMKVAKG